MLSPLIILKHAPSLPRPSVPWALAVRPRRETRRRLRGRGGHPTPHRPTGPVLVRGPCTCRPLSDPHALGTVRTAPLPPPTVASRCQRQCPPRGPRHSTSPLLGAVPCAQEKTRPSLSWARRGSRRPESPFVPAACPPLAGRYHLCPPLSCLAAAACPSTRARASRFELSDCGAPFLSARGFPRRCARAAVGR